MCLHILSLKGKTRVIVRTCAVLLLVAGCAIAQNTSAEQREPGRAHNPNEDSLEVRDIRESSAKDVGEALQSLTGISKVRKGGIANDVVLRGFQQDNISVQIDGARVYGACPNNMDPSASHVDFAEVDRVELTKGPFDVRTQGSLGGTVRIITREEEPYGVRFTPSLGYGSFGFYNPSAELSTAKPLVNMSAGYAFRTSDAYEDGSGNRFTQYGNFRPEMRDSRAFEGHSGWGTLAFSPANHQKLDIGYSRQQNGVTLYPYLMMDGVYDNADRATIKYAVRGISGFIRELRADGFATKVNHLMDDARRTSSGPLPFSMQTHATTSALGLNVAAELNGDLTVGIDSYRRTWNALTTMRSAAGQRVQHSLPKVSMTSFGSFAELDHELARRVRLQGGVRFDHVESRTSSSTLRPDLYFAYNGTRSGAATDNSVGGNLRVSFAVRKGVNVFAGFGSTVRVPDPQERFFALQRMNQDWVGNPALKPTRNSEADLGISLRAGAATLRTVFFFSRLDDYIALHRQVRLHVQPGVMNLVSQSYTNVDARMYGGEISMSLPVGKFIAVSGGASITRGSKDTNPLIAVLNSNLAEMPPAKSWLNVRYANKWFYAQAGGTASAAQRRVDRDLSELPSPGFGVLNTKLGIHHPRFDLNLGIDNLLDRFYYESFSYSRDPFRSGLKVAEPGRALHLNLSFHLGSSS